MLLNITMDEQIYKGDTIIAQIDIDEDVTEWEIRAEIYDLSGNSVKMASENVTGGSDEQIYVEHDSGSTLWSIFIVVPADGTNSFDDIASFEVETVNTSDVKKTIVHMKVPLIDDQIRWDDRT